ncbi:hypothetical protein DPMN_165484 [Dreissena polymorpha]|uniref:Uncharacterized protein n=1 Tax=Dreissena polymorpha TaxID=45954 RepID=A0A9D4EVE4_DREPO|nr:hypothetical protein DPMN_165484 [Dreissena polymorpha]
MKLLIHNLLNLAIAAFVEAFLIPASAILLKSLEMVAPKYLKLVASSSFSPFMVMSALIRYYCLCHTSQVGDRFDTDGNRVVMVFEDLLHYIRKEKIKQDGGAQTSLTYFFLSPKEVIHLSVETYTAAGVSVELLYDLHQPFVNVESSQNLS